MQRRFILLFSLLQACSGDLRTPLGPGESARDSFESPASGSIAGPSCEDQGPYGASTPLRRLTRSQLANSVRDLLSQALGEPAASALGASYAAAMPADDRAGPFAANAVASVSEAHVRVFASGAELVAQAVSAPEVMSKLAPCEAGDDARCARAFAEAFGARVFRRPLDEATVTALAGVYDAARAAGYEHGIAGMLAAMLEAPDFLYHVEQIPPPDGKVRQTTLDAYELASRLSYFLWDSMPDDALFAAARAGELSNERGIARQAERLLKDPRAKDALARLTVDWLAIDGLEHVTRDPAKFPGFDEELARAMRDDTIAVVDYVVRRGDGLLSSLLSSRLSFARGALASFYGVTPAKDAHSPIELGRERAGILTHASFLTASSHGDQTSPVKRGALVLNNVLCQDIELPTGLEIPKLEDPDPRQTTRERFAAHTEQPACASCHTRIDPIGFAFERYDPTGAYREREGDQTIDDTGDVRVDDPALAGPVEGAVELANKLARSEDARSCLVRQIYRFALRRKERAADSCALARLEQRFAAADGNVRALLVELAVAEAFRAAPRQEEQR